MNYINKKDIVYRTLILLSFPLLIYWKDFVILYNEAINSEISTHIILIPFLIGYIIFTKRLLIASNIALIQKKTIIAYNLEYKNLVGSLLLITSILLKWYGSYSFNSLEYHMFSLPIFISGLVLIIFNFNTLKILQFPLFLILLMIPPPFETAQQIGSFLAVFSSVIAFNILKIGGYPVVMESLYGNPVIFLTEKNGVQVPFTIDIGCSGLYSFIGLLIFAFFFTYISKGSIYKKILLMISGFPILYCLNVLRISLLLLVAFYFGSGTGLNVFHLLGGWTLTFLGSFLILVAGERLLNIELPRKKGLSCNHITDGNKYCSICGRIVAIDIKHFTKREGMKYALIYLLLISLVSIDVPTFVINSDQLGIFSMKFTGEEEYTSILPEIEEYGLEFIYRDTGFEKISGQNSSLLFVYSPLNKSKERAWVQVETGSVKGTMHNWEACLINYPALVNRVKYVSIDLHDIHLLDNPPLSARFFSFHERDRDATQVVLYWFVQTVFQTDTGYQNMWSKISVIQYVDTPNLYVKAEENILPIAIEIANYWHPIATWSEVTITIARFGLIIIGGLALLLATIIGYMQWVEWNRNKDLNVLFSHIIDPVDKEIIEKIRKSNKKGLTYPEILNEFRDLELTERELIQKLYYASEVGFVKRGILNIDEEPYYSWRIGF